MAPRTRLSVKLGGVSVVMAVVAGILTAITWDVGVIGGPFSLLALFLVMASCMSFLTSLLFWHVAMLNPADSHQVASLAVHLLMIDVMPILGQIDFRTLAKKATNCHEAQQTVLLKIIRDQQGTAYGLDHGFKDIKSTNEFVKSQPLTTYADYHGYIERTVCGEDNVMFKEPVVYVATSSGTTGKNKLFPINQRYASSAFGRIYIHLLKQRLTPLPLGRFITLSNKPKIRKSPKEIDIGPLTYYALPYPPHALSPKPAFEIEQENVALYVHALFGLAERYVVHIDGRMSPTVFTFFRTIEDNWEELCDDLQTGTLKSDLEIEENLRAELETYLKPEPVRANELRAEFRRGFGGIAKRIWPDIKAVQMVASGGLSAYAKLVMDSYGKGLNLLDMGHGSSEGVIGLNLSDNVKDTRYTSLPHIGIFYEFIEESHIHEVNPPTLLMGELQIGHSYEVLLTNSCGLYRYRLGDVIKVVGFFHQCPTYEFLYRVGQMLNVTWEKTPEHVVYATIEETVDQLPEGVKLIDYTTMESSVWEDATGERVSGKYYVLLIELEQECAPYNLTDREMNKFDSTLRAKFELYDELRGNGSICCMQVKQVHPGAFSALRQAMNKETCNQQFKMPRVLRKPEFIQIIAGKLLK